MKSTGRKSEKSGYLVILLLMVGLTAFSHSMKELTEIHQLTLDASRLVAQWSGNVTPAEVPQIPEIPQVSQTAQTIIRLEKLESCESKLSAQVVEPQIPRIERPVAIAKLKKPHRVDFDADAFEVRVPAVQLPDADEFPAFTFKTKIRRPGAVKFTPRDREMLLKTLNRSINLRIAS